MRKYDLTELAKKQLVLDKYIKDKIDITDDEYWSSRVVALNVELNELINEIRFFKYWSEKPASAKEVILDEFVDCVHFALSLGNTLGIKEYPFGFDDMKRPIEFIYFDITEKIVKLRFDKSIELFNSLLFNIIEIAWYMGYDMEDINNAYKIKNEINYKRQDSGY